MSGLGSSLRSLINELPEDLEELLDFSEEEKAKGLPELFTPLHYTAQEGNLTLCRAMLEKGAFVDPRDSRNLTPLACAATQGHLDVCNLLLEFGADPDSKANFGITPLVPAACKGHLDVMSLLLSKGAYIDTHLSIGTTLLGYITSAGALMNDDSAYDVAKFLLENGSDPNASENTFVYPLMLAASENNLEMVQLLLQYGADPKAVEENLWTALHLSAQHDHPHTLDVVMLLIASQDVDVNAQTVELVTALYLAVQSNRVDVVECLIAAGADLDISTDKDITALGLAIVKSNLAMVNLLLDHGADPQRVDERGLSILHVAAGNSNVATMKRILEEDIDLDLRSHTMAQTTALHVAVRENKVDVVECLLVAGANVEIEAYNDITALGVAVMGGNLAMVNLLLDHGANSQRVDKKGLSLLHVAAMQSNVAVLKRIFEEGIDLELRTYNSPSRTALHLAVTNDNNEIALTLLEHGALP